MTCPHCGAENDTQANLCVHCNKYLPPMPVTAMSGDSSRDAAPLSGIIPYKNPPALMAYYFGVFALAPCLGLLLGPAAFVLGIIGLKRASRHPEQKGKVHAWIGILLGSLCSILNLIGLLWFLSMLAARQ
jgi:hypothetical protein